MKLLSTEFGMVKFLFRHLVILLSLLISSSQCIPTHFLPDLNDQQHLLFRDVTSTISSRQLEQELRTFASMCPPLPTDAQNLQAFSEIEKAVESCPVEVLTRLHETEMKVPPQVLSKLATSNQHDETFLHWAIEQLRENSDEMVTFLDGLGDLSSLAWTSVGLRLSPSSHHAAPWRGWKEMLDALTADFLFNGEYSKGTRFRLVLELDPAVLLNCDNDDQDGFCLEELLHWLHEHEQEGELIFKNIFFWDLELGQSMHERRPWFRFLNEMLKRSAFDFLEDARDREVDVSLAVAFADVLYESELRWIFLKATEGEHNQRINLTYEEVPVLWLFRGLMSDDRSLPDDDILVEVSPHLTASRLGRVFKEDAIEAQKVLSSGEFGSSPFGESEAAARSQEVNKLIISLQEEKGILDIIQSAKRERDDFMMMLEILPPRVLRTNLPRLDRLTHEEVNILSHLSTRGASVILSTMLSHSFLLFGSPNYRKALAALMHGLSTYHVESIPLVSTERIAKIYLTKLVERRGESNSWVIGQFELDTFKSLKRRLEKYLDEAKKGSLADGDDENVYEQCQTWRLLDEIVSTSPDSSVLSEYPSSQVWGEKSLQVDAPQMMPTLLTQGESEVDLSDWDVHLFLDTVWKGEGAHNGHPRFRRQSSDSSSSLQSSTSPPSPDCDLTSLVFTQSLFNIVLSLVEDRMGTHPLAPVIKIGPLVINMVSYRQSVLGNLPRVKGSSNAIVVEEDVPGNLNSSDAIKIQSLDVNEETKETLRQALTELYVKGTRYLLSSEYIVPEELDLRLECHISDMDKYSIFPMTIIDEMYERRDYRARGYHPFEHSVLEDTTRNASRLLLVFALGSLTPRGVTASTLEKGSSLMRDLHTTVLQIYNRTVTELPHDQDAISSGTRIEYALALEREEFFDRLRNIFGLSGVEDDRVMKTVQRVLLDDKDRKAYLMESLSFQFRVIKTFIDIIGIKYGDITEDYFEDVPGDVVKALFAAHVSNVTIEEPSSSHDDLESQLIQYGIDNHISFKTSPAAVLSCFFGLLTTELCDADPILQYYESYIWAILQAPPYDHEWFVDFVEGLTHNKPESIGDDMDKVLILSMLVKLKDYRDAHSDDQDSRLADEIVKFEMYIKQQEIRLKQQLQYANSAQDNDSIRYFCYQMALEISSVIISSFDMSPSELEQSIVPHPVLTYLFESDIQASHMTANSQYSGSAGVSSAKQIECDFSEERKDDCISQLFDNVVHVLSMRGSESQLNQTFIEYVRGLQQESTDSVAHDSDPADLIQQKVQLAEAIINHLKLTPHDVGFGHEDHKKIEEMRHIFKWYFVKMSQEQRKALLQVDDLFQKVKELLDKRTLTKEESNQVVLLKSKVNRDSILVAEKFLKVNASGISKQTVSRILAEKVRKKELSDIVVDEVNEFALLQKVYIIRRLVKILNLNKNDFNVDLLSTIPVHYAGIIFAPEVTPNEISEILEGNVAQATTSTRVPTSPSTTDEEMTTSTEARTTPPSTEARTTPPSTEARTTPPSTEAKTTASSTEARTTPPSTEARTTPPSTEARTTPPSTEARTTPPSTEARTTPPSTEARTTPPSTEARTTASSTDFATSLTEFPAVRTSPSDSTTTMQPGTSSPPSEATTTLLLTENKELETVAYREGSAASNQRVISEIADTEEKVLHSVEVDMGNKEKRETESEVTRMDVLMNTAFYLYHIAVTIASRRKSHDQLDEIQSTGLDAILDQQLGKILNRLYGKHGLSDLEIDDLTETGYVFLKAEALDGQEMDKINEEIIKQQLKITKQIVLLLGLTASDLQMNNGFFPLATGIIKYLFESAPALKGDAYIRSANDAYDQITRLLSLRAKNGDLSSAQAQIAKGIIHGLNQRSVTLMVTTLGIDDSEVPPNELIAAIKHQMLDLNTDSNKISTIKELVYVEKVKAIQQFVLLLDVTDKDVVLPPHMPTDLRTHLFNQQSAFDTLRQQHKAEEEWQNPENDGNNIVGGICMSCFHRLYTQWRREHNIAPDMTEGQGQRGDLAEAGRFNDKESPEKLWEEFKFLEEGFSALGDLVKEDQELQNGHIDPSQFEVENAVEDTDDPLQTSADTTPMKASVQDKRRKRAVEDNEYEEQPTCQQLRSLGLNKIYLSSEEGMKMRAEELLACADLIEAVDEVWVKSWEEMSRDGILSPSLKVVIFEKAPLLIYEEARKGLLSLNELISLSRSLHEQPRQHDRNCLAEMMAPPSENETKLFPNEKTTVEEAIWLLLDVPCFAFHVSLRGILSSSLQLSGNNYDSDDDYANSRQMYGTLLAGAVAESVRRTSDVFDGSAAVMEDNLRLAAELAENEVFESLLRNDFCLEEDALIDRVPSHMEALRRSCIAQKADDLRWLDAAAAHLNKEVLATGGSKEAFTGLSHSAVRQMTSGDNSIYLDL